MKIVEMEKLLKSKRDESFKLDEDIRALKIKLDMKKDPSRICHKCREGFMYDDGFGYADIRICSKCRYEQY